MRRGIDLISLLSITGVVASLAMFVSGAVAASAEVDASACRQGRHLMARIAEVERSLPLRYAVIVDRLADDVREHCR